VHCGFVHIRTDDTCDGTAKCANLETGELLDFGNRVPVTPVVQKSQVVFERKG